MKFSSVPICEYGAPTAAARAAIGVLGHTPIMAELRGEPEVAPFACLSGVREAGVTVLILGSEYGVRQQSG